VIRLVFNKGLQSLAETTSEIDIRLGSLSCHIVYVLYILFCQNGWRKSSFIIGQKSVTLVSKSSSCVFDRSLCSTYSWFISL